MNRLSYIALLFTAFLLNGSANCSVDAEEGKDKASKYIREEIATSYGRDSTGKWIMFFKERRVELLNVKIDGYKYHVVGELEAESYYTVRGERRKKPLVSTNIVRIEETFNLSSEIPNSNLPPKSLFTGTASPSIPYQYFCLPMYDFKEHKLMADEGVINLQSPKEMRTSFSGSGAYRVARTSSEHKRVSIPFRFASSDGHCVLQGTLEKTIIESPLTFVEMKGEIMVTVDPPTKWSVIGFAEKPKPFLKKFTKVCGYVHYQMVPMDSKEGKLIRYSDRLWKSFKKE